MSAHHPTRNITEAMHHLTRGKFALEWWVGGIALGVAAPIALGAVFLATSGDAMWASVLGGVTAAAGIWFADDAYVRAGQSVPLS